MAATPTKLLRALVDFYQGGAKLYAAGNLYPESDALLLMKARGEAEAHKVQPESKAARAAREAAERAEREAAEKEERDAAALAEREADEVAQREAAQKAEQDAKDAADKASQKAEQGSSTGASNDQNHNA